MPVAFFLLLACSLLAARAPAQVDKTEDPLAASRTFLLMEQRDDGSWLADPSYADKKDDATSMVTSWKNYLCDDTLAATALCARALLAWPAADDAATATAVEKALAYLTRTMAEHDARFRTPQCSPIWQAYALDLLLDLRRRAADEAKRDSLSDAIRGIVAYAAGGECKGGGWTYAYYDSTKGTPRSFTTALMLRSLLSVREAGIELPAGPLERGLARLDATRLEDGGYRYVYDRRDWPPRATPMGSIGRMALIEATRQRAGRGDLDAVQAAIATVFEHRTLLEEAIDEQTRYGNEGCHYHFAWYHLAEALALLPADIGATWRQEARQVLWHRRRADGSWWDSARAGPRVGTALAMLALAELGAAPLRAGK